MCCTCITLVEADANLFEGDLKTHSFMMNGVFDDQKGSQYIVKYNIMKADDYITWLRSVISSPVRELS